MQDTQVAVLGSGIAGCLVACLLADRGHEVTLIDRHAEPMSAASRWNEGKLHLGFTYVGAGSLDTARLMIEGAGVFEDVIERVTGSPLPESWYTGRVIYVVDPDSQFTAELLWQRSVAVADCASQAASMLPRLRRQLGAGALLRALSPIQAAQATGVERIHAAWETAERAIAPGPVAAQLRSAVGGRAVQRLQGEIESVRSSPDGWCIALAGGGDLHADAVVNCTWESRIRLDKPLLPRPEPTSIRYKYGLFGSGLHHACKFAPSTRILGRFGDITPYANGDLYLAWYPAGLAGLSDDGIAPQVAPAGHEQMVAATLAGLGIDRDILESGNAAWNIRGGFVVAPGGGDIDHAGSPLHERSRPAARELAPGYVSVDTGKYSLGPLLAMRAVELVAARLGASAHRRA